MMNFDYNRVQEQFNEVIEYSQCIDDVKSDGIFKSWLENKKKFIEKWGGLTYELPQEIQLDIPEEDKNIIMRDFATDCAVFAKTPAIKEFLIAQGTGGFYANRVEVAWDKDGIKINKGAKLSKCLKFFFDDKLFLDRFQVKLSRIIQDCKITGKMVMSVHPVDFLSTSETAHNWHSCHALDGEYRAGNISHMIDGHTFIIYLKADKDYKLPNFPFEWNSKKWRVLMYMREDEQLFVSGRQYPFANANAMTIATEQLIGKFYDISKFTSWTSVEKVINNIMKDALGSLQYNDCLNSPSYKPVAIYNPEIEGSLHSRDVQFEVGDAVTCLDCGGMMISLPSGMMCDECAGYVYCDSCGEPHYEDDLYELNGEWICESCWDDTVTYCASCDVAYDHYNDELHWDEENCEYYCPDCYDSLIEAREEARTTTYQGEL